MTNQIFNLQLVPQKNPLGWKYYNFAAGSTQIAHTQADAYNSNELTPGVWATEALRAAVERMVFRQAVQEVTLQPNAQDYIFPRITRFLATGDYAASAAEYSGNTDITWTLYNNVDGVVVTPTQSNYGILFSNRVLRENAINLLARAREDLQNQFLRRQENTISAALTDATAMSDTVNGQQTLFGGTAVNTSNDLDAGEILTPELINKARRLLKSNNGYYYSSNVFTKSSTAKNAWEPESNSPFLLFIAPEQEESLLNEPQFTNASEYGSGMPVLTGEIGNFLGVRILTSTTVPSFGTDQTTSVTVQGTAVSTDVNGHQVLMVKPGVCAGLVHARNAEIKTFDWPSADQTRLTLHYANAAAATQSDAIVRIIVADE